MRLQTIVLAVLCCVMPLLAGCSLFGPSVEKAQEIAEKREAQFVEARDNLDKARREAEIVIADFKQAQESGDPALIASTGEAVAAVLAKLDVYERAYDSAAGLLDAAIEDFKEAKSTSDYLGTIFGWLTSIFGGLFGVAGTGAVVQTLRVRTRDEALSGTTGSIERLKSSPDAKQAWGEVKRDMQARLSGSALKVIDAVRP